MPVCSGRMLGLPRMKGLITTGERPTRSCPMGARLGRWASAQVTPKIDPCAASWSTTSLASWVSLQHRAHLEAQMAPLDESPRTRKPPRRLIWRKRNREGQLNGEFLVKQFEIAWIVWMSASRLWWWLLVELRKSLLWPQKRVRLVIYVFVVVVLLPSFCCMLVRPKILIIRCSF